METNTMFRKAERKKAKTRIALCAPAGGGKTHSALLLASGLGKRIALIDTENGSASLEVGKKNIPDFDVVNLCPPFDPSKYIEAIKAAEEAGYDVIIIDSLSHAWSGSGGLLDKHDKISQIKGNNSYTAWRFITPMHNALVDAILQSKCHIIATMRTKVEYSIDKDEQGKAKISKMGMAPIQREGMDYEFTTVFDIQRDSHLASAGKDRTSLFDDKIFTISKETGKIFAKWIESGADEHPTEEQTAKFNDQLAVLGLSQKKWETATKLKWDKLTEADAAKWIRAHEVKIAKNNNVKQ